MSESNKATLLRANAFVEKGDYESFLAHCTDDTEWTFLGDRTLRGKAAVRQYMNATYVRPPVFSVGRLIAEGDTVAATGEIAIEDAAGKVTRSAYCDVWQFRDGKLHTLTAYVVDLGIET